jgi:hypothetical protein
MLKTISAALLAVSFIAAPALAATATKTTKAPVTKTTTAPVIKAEPVKSKVLNANARMSHHKHYRHHRYHKHMGMLKTHAAPKFAVKHIAPAKRG